MQTVTVYTAGVCVNSYTSTQRCAYGVYYSSESIHNIGHLSGGFNGDGVYAALDGIRSVLQSVSMHPNGPNASSPVVIKTNVALAACYAMDPIQAPLEYRELAMLIKRMCAERLHTPSIVFSVRGVMESGIKEAIDLAVGAARSI
ncbi:hypothetical protein GGI05_000524 [Coemansia sp. RSA 2603]|nr:hypothetical protein GGI05_000524 [Coemansia sp. RSA 2603]